MITRWKLFNFKSFRRETEIEFGPLTLFAGTNSSGKSTLLQSILLISQTLASKVESRSVVLNGYLTKLGQFDDLRAFNSEADQITIGWACHPQSYELSQFGQFSDEPELASDSEYADSIGAIDCEISIEADPNSQGEIGKINPRLFSLTLSGQTKGDIDDSGGPFRITLSRSPVGTSEKARATNALISEDDLLQRSLRFDVALDDPSPRTWVGGLNSAIPFGAIVSHFLPVRLTVLYDLKEELAGILSRELTLRQVRSGLLRSIPPDRLVIPSSVLDLITKKVNDHLTEDGPNPRLLAFLEQERTQTPMTLFEWRDFVRSLSISDRGWLRRVLASDPLSDEIRQTVLSQSPREPAIRLTGLPSSVAAAVRYTRVFFSRNIRYLGPLRDEPKALYPLVASADPGDVGVHGEYTAAVLDLHKDRLITYLPSSNFATPAIIHATSVRTLKSAVLDWLRYMGVVEDVETQDRGKLGHELKVKLSENGKANDLTHVGVGVSQVLPIVVACLLAPTDTTFVIEQPELHLHPKVQTLLGDFFLAMAILNKQCIIETHSEYLINRIRYRSAAAAGEEITALVRMYFAELKDGQTELRSIKMNQYGAITDWPQGFFDQSQDEAERILRAATQKRKEQRKGQNQP